MTELSSVQQWSYPFNLKGKEGQSSKPVTDPLQYFDALTKAKGGYYPIGKNGLWHGGVHFDSGTAASLDQSAIRCIADGEVVAYRIDDTYKKSNFSSGEKLFSTGFVLVRHKLELPKLSEQANTTNTPTEQPSLIFYSLYMHLLDWAGYTGENAPTPPNFLNKAVYSVKADKATDVVKGLRVRTAPRNGQVKAVLPKGTRVKLGEQSATHNKWYRLVSILEGQALPAINLDEECWVFEGQLDNTDVSDERLVGVKANDTEPTLAPQKGLNIRKAATGADKNLLTGLIPVDVTFTLEADTGRYCKIKEFISGQNILPLKEDCIKNISGYVYKECLQASRTPPTLNDIHVLDSPHPIRAGEIIGHLGIYQNHDDTAAEPMLHLEVFSCEDVPAFIEKTKAAAASLPDDKKNLLKIHKGASKLISHRSDISASNPPKLSDAGTVIGVDMIFNLEVLNNYPLDRKITVTETSQGNKTRTWWRLDNILADQQGNKISGWLTEQSEFTTRHSPWEWEGFDFISETPCNLDHLACHFDSSGQLDESERADYAARVDLSDNGPIKKRLYDIIDTNNDKKLSPEEIKAALALPWSAQSIYKIIACYESEWFWNSVKWNDLDTLMSFSEEAKQNWETEKDRIKVLSWWKNIISTEDGTEQKKVWHINATALIEQHYTPNKDLITFEQMLKIFPQSNEATREEVRKLFNFYARRFEINNRERISQFFAQVKTEVGSELKGKEESLWFSVESLKDTYKRYFNTYPEEAESLGYKRIEIRDFNKLPASERARYTVRKQYAYSQLPKPDEIAKRVYCCNNSVGDFALHPGGCDDGLKYKGKGFIQLTWKINYRKVNDILKQKVPEETFDIVQNPDQVLETKMGILSAMGFWEVNKLNEKVAANIESTNEITKVVNLNTKSYKERRENFESIYEILK